jgi:DNA-binding HxlR family transcriptional regulator
MLFSGGAFFPGDHEAAVVGQGKGVAPVEAMTKAVLGVLKDEPKVQISKMYSLVQKGCSVGEKVVREHLRNMVDEGVIHRTPICKKPFIEGFTLAGLFD